MLLHGDPLLIKLRRKCSSSNNQQATRTFSPSLLTYMITDVAGGGRAEKSGDTAAETARSPPPAAATTSIFTSVQTLQTYPLHGERKKVPHTHANTSSIDTHLACLVSSEAGRLTPALGGRHAHGSATFNSDSSGSEVAGVGSRLRFTARRWI